MRVRGWLTVLLLVLACGAVPAAADPAPAGTATAQPNQVGKPSSIVIRASGSSGGLGQSLPQGVTVALFSGFGVDLGAVSERCGASDAKNATCPAASRVATGQFQGQASFAGTQQPISGTLNAFLAPPSGGDLADVVVEVSAGGQSRSGRGQLVAVNQAPFGYELRFDPLPASMVPPGASVSIDQLTLTIGASRVEGARPPVPKRPAAHRRHRRCRTKHCARRRRASRHRRVSAPRRGKRARGPAVTHSLLTNPSTCSGSWPLQLRVRYSDHTDVRDAPIACTG